MISRSDDLENGGGGQTPSMYVSPKELSKRWQCSRSSVDRIADRMKMSRVCLGEGKNGMVRYLRREVEAFEASRMVQRRYR